MSAAFERPRCHKIIDLQSKRNKQQSSVFKYNCHTITLHISVFIKYCNTEGNMIPFVTFIALDHGHIQKLRHSAKTKKLTFKPGNIPLIKHFLKCLLIAS